VLDELVVSVLFSEPKIPQFFCVALCCAHCIVSVLFSEPKIPQFYAPVASVADGKVSVLFSEPKIPQLIKGGVNVKDVMSFQCSSASRKFLNTTATSAGASHCRRFSALQRAENSSMALGLANVGGSASFSALQRAENSSIHHRRGQFVVEHCRFQCSSASRKFLNSKRIGSRCGR